MLVNTFFKRHVHVILIALFVTFFSGSLSSAATTVTAQDKSVSTYENVSSKSVVLRATGTRGETFTYSIVTWPAHGSLSLSDRTAVYVPQTNFNGTDTFQYQAEGSMNGLSNIATVTMTVSPRNDAPVATAGISTVTNENSAVRIALSGTDIDGDALTCFAGTATSGSFLVDETTCIGTFTPFTDFVGNGTAMFRVYDGQTYSGYESVSVTIENVNEAPVAEDVSKTIMEDASSLVLLQAQDGDKDVLTYRVVSAPLHGTASTDGASVNYVPDENFNGQDQFTYVANDGAADSNVATAFITISAVNDAPVVEPLFYEMPKNQRLVIFLEGSDPDGQLLTYGISSSPTHGRLETVSDQQVEYVPDEDFIGMDSFEYWASDGSAYPKAMVTISVDGSDHSVAPGVGTIVWEYDLGSATVSGAPAFDQAGRIYFGAFFGSSLFYALSPEGLLVDVVDTGLNVESSPMLLNQMLVANTVFTGGTFPSDVTQGLLGGVPLHERLGTMAVGLFSDGTFNENMVWGDVSVMNGRDGSPGRNEDGSIVYAADIFRPEDTTGRKPELVSLDSATGAVLQTVEIPGWTYSSPLFLPNRETESKKDGLVVIGSEVPDYDSVGGSFQGNGGTGELRAYQVDEYGVMESTPAWFVTGESGFSRGASAARVGDQTLLFTGTQNGTLFGIRPEDGSIVWQFATGGNGFGTLTLSPDNTTVYAVMAAASSTVVEHPLYANLIAIDTLTGEIRWTHAITNKGALAIVGDRAVYVLGEDEVLAVDQEGEEIWSLPLTDTPYYGYASLMPETGLLVFGAGTKMVAVQTESTGPSMTSDWPSYRATPDNAGIPQQN
ncbi:tandem-95 repeat protein [Patescibacteria group bacterium]|nr:MAG: tandem-95 repeat protein [Patescibacteria group bacterium]